MLDDKSKIMYQEAINLIETHDFSHLVKIHELNLIKSDETVLLQSQYTKLHAQGKR